MSLATEQRGPVRSLRIDRPHRANALDPATSEALGAALQAADAAPDVRVMILTGTGDRAFCSGADLRASAPGETSVSAVTKRLGLRKPLIAAVNGAAVGGGLEVVLTADLRIAVPTAIFALPEADVGMLAGGGGAVRLADNLPWAIASDVLLRGRVLDAEEALHFGLINAIVDPDALLITAWTMAEEIAARAPLAVQAAKEIQWRTQGMDLSAALEFEERRSLEIKGTTDAREGVEAFLEGRSPRFVGS